ncbi:winged helix-turn-helix domain-containing protein [Halostella salina]|uniref:winged helix-turn-helix domain-containing protein n=1 Tax=Halostella salina TaxID=1547897 RepID=UPI000EF75934|nr:helix-turn-helix domain-containing protein [Halostella salina]
MTGGTSAEDSLQSVLESLADPDCRRILSELDQPRSFQEVAKRCDLPETSTYRKLESLSAADLIAEGTKVRSDGHHIKTYERDVSGVLVLIDDDSGVEFEFVSEVSSPDRQLARLWSQVSEEL